MRVLVIGATDPVGQRLTERLLARGDDIRVAVTPIEEQDLRHAERLDVVCLEDPEADAARAVPNVELIYDLGERMADTSAAFGALWSASLDRSTALLDAALHTPTVRRFVFLSSVAVYRQVPRRSRWPLAEDHPLEAHGAPDLERFGAAKITAEHRLATAAAGRPDLEVTVLRTSSVYGPGVQWAADLVDAAIRTETSQTDSDSDSDPDHSRTPMQWTHVDDLVEGLVQGGVQQAAAGRTYNVTGGELFTRRDVERAARIVGRGWPWPAVLGDLSQSLKYDIARAGAELGYVPRVGLADGIAGLAVECRSGWW
jgi:nucleoside-diphosphate-sugar epimerase